MRGIVWFRRDLRVNDQPALAAALKECHEVIPVFVFDEPLLASRQFGAAAVNFMLSCLTDLAHSLSELGLRLSWRQGVPTEEILKLAQEVGAESVYWNRDYEPAAVERDRIVGQELSKKGVLVRTFKDHVVFEAQEIRGSTGNPLQRFGAYKARWWSRWRAEPPAITGFSRKAWSRRIIIRPPPVRLPAPSELGYETVPLWTSGGERTAQKRLRWFLDGPIHDYAAGRNLPSVDGTSILSPHFRFGTVTTRSAAHDALDNLTRRGKVSRQGVMTWVDDLVWRDFFQQVLVCFPHVATGPFREKAGLPHRRKNVQLYEAWCQGKTGFSLVDAGMRQLNQTGWMHNRVRMVVASFLVKDLLLDWRLGEQYFMHHLLDADLAANNGNWQWCASTGTDAMPGYRIFNPVLQAKKFDPDGDYIRHFVQELAQLPTRLIHQPELMTRDEQDRYGCRIGQDYPKPIVDHNKARQEYLRLARN